MTRVGLETDIIKSENIKTYGNWQNIQNENEKISTKYNVSVRKYSLVVTTILIYLFSVGFGYCLSVLYPEFIRVFKSSSSEAALAQNFFIAFNVGGVILWNPIAVRYGQGICVMFGACVFVFGVFIAQFATNIWIIIVCLGMVGGAGSSITSFGPSILINDRFDKWKQAVFAAVYTGPSLGQFCFPYFIEYLLEEYNWSGCLFVMSAVTANLIPCAILIYFIEKDQIMSKETVTKYSPTGKLFDIRVFKEWRIYPLLINGLLIAFSVFVESNFLVDFMILKGFKRATGAILVSYMGLANLAGRVVTFILKLIFHSGNCLIQIAIFTLFIGVSHAIILLTGSYYGILTGALLNGFSVGLFLPQLPLLLLDIYPSEMYGAAYSVWNISIGLGFCLGGFFGGFIRDITGAYDLFFQLAIMCNVVMIINFLITGVSKAVPCKKQYGIGTDVKQTDS